MLEILLILLINTAGAAICYSAGHTVATRRNRRQNAATASCVACQWTSGPVPLSEAFTAASVHSDGEAHRTMVERAR